MSNFKENNAALKIQILFRLNNCVKMLEKFHFLNLEKLAEKLNFDEFKKIIIKKDIIDTTQNFTFALDNYKKGLGINPRILITSYLIKYYSEELLGEPNDRHPSDDYILTLSSNVISSLKTNDIKEIWDILREFKHSFKSWSSIDKDRTIERLVISYYYRSEHIDKIKSNELVKNLELIDTEQQNQMIQELDRQRNDILKSIKLIDRTFDVNYLKKNYVEIFNSIQKSWTNIKINLSNNMKKAYYDMLCKDIENGNLISCFNLLIEIGERLGIICPSKQAEGFKNKFNEDNLTNILAAPEFTPQLVKFIGFIIDFILLMDAPVNDEVNKLWKAEIAQIIISGNFAYNFPKILIQIEEHIDIIYDLIIKLNENNN
jgi:hypothetical protein